MLRRRLLTLGILCGSGVLLGTLGTWSWDLGHGYSALWPALVVQVSGGIWFGGWGVLAAMLFPVLSNALAGVGPVGMIGYIPANVVQGIIPAWAFRRFRVDPLLPQGKDVLFFLLWGAILPSTAGAILGATAVILFGEAHWNQFLLLVWKWAAPHTVVASAIGIPVMRIFTPLWRDLHVLVAGWWGLQTDVTQRIERRRFRDLPLRLKLVLSMCGVGLCPILALSLYEVASQGRESRPTPLFLTISLVASVLVVGWLSGEVIRPLLHLKERVESLVQEPEGTLGIDRRDEIGQVARAFETLLMGRRKAEEGVRRSEAQLQSFVQTAPFGITRASLKQDRFLNVNPALVKMLGYKSEPEVLALSLSRDLYLEGGGREQLLTQVPPVGEYREVEVRWKRKDGKPITVRGKVRAVPSEAASDDLVIEAIEEDVTQQRLLEERLQQAQKMEAVGQLAGGVAHDFNNLLGVILGYSELLAPDLSKDPQQLTKLKAISGAAERAAALTSQLLAFSRKQVLQTRPVDLNTIVSDTEKMLRRLIGENIQLTVKLEPELGEINADSGQLVQVIMNLSVNARDAMPQGGQLTIETARMKLNRELVHESGSVPPGEYAVLKVVDTGTGIDAATRARIFEPFFTTKGVGQGTGLGLATVYGIVAQSAGHILVHSELGEGTRFEVFFPCASEAKRAEEVAVAAPRSTSGSGTILLVEDAADLREMVHRSLQMLGYNVLEAASGAQAIEQATKHSGAIDVLLTDIVMPEMSGTELAERITAIQSQIKVLYMSGYAHHASVGAAGLQAGPAFLQKPFSLEALAQKLRETLDSRSAPLA